MEPCMPLAAVLCTLPSRLSRCGSLPLVPVDTSGHPLIHWVWPRSSLPWPLWPFSGCTKDSFIKANRKWGSLVHCPLQSSPNRGEKETPFTVHTLNWWVKTVSTKSHWCQISWHFKWHLQLHPGLDKTTMGVSRKGEFGGRLRGWLLVQRERKKEREVA